MMTFVRTAELLYESVALIRAVEERVIEEYPTRRIRMPVHLSIGQEGVAAGLMVGSRTTDTVIGTHRSHAFYLAKGGDLQALVDELYSLPSGCSLGRGGSMHLTDQEVGFLGSTAVLGGGVPISVGLAFANRARQVDDVVYAITGDGGVDEGSFYEALNLASLWSLPVIFVVENNGYSTLTSQANRQAVTDILSKSEAFGVPASRFCGSDTVGLSAHAAPVVMRSRRGEGPQLIEVTTHRHLGHVGISSDWGSGRPLSAEPDWSVVDPLARHHWINHVASERLDAVLDRVKTRIDLAFRSAIDRFELMNREMKLEAPPSPDSASV
jgi:pyruvate dehydrogenase E1 component alpha subunit